MERWKHGRCQSLVVDRGWVELENVDLCFCTSAFGYIGSDFIDSAVYECLLRFAKSAYGPDKLYFFRNDIVANASMNGTYGDYRWILGDPTVCWW